MSSFDLIIMGLKNLFRRKLRTFLTTLGIIIGTISIVVMVSLGIGMQQSMDAQLSQWADISIINVSPPRDMGEKNTSKKPKLIKDSDIQEISKIEGVEVVSPVIEMNASFKSGRYVNGYVQIQGMTLEFLQKYGLTIREGRMLEKNDKASMIMGGFVPYEFFDKSERNPEWEYPIDDDGNFKPTKFDVIKKPMVMSLQSRGGNDSKQKTYRMKVVGLTGDKGWRKAGCIYMDFNQLKKIKDEHDKISGYPETNGKRPPKGYNKLLVRVPDREDIKNVENTIKDMGFETRTSLEMLEEQQKITRIIELIFGGIGAISLFVAAIGITNTMVMAIYERRKEIGVMKVIGSSLKDIKKLFLFEAAAIGFLGGTLGLILSLLISKGLNVILANFAQQMGPDAKLSVIPLWLLGAALAFTTFVGLVSGYLPARKAMKLSALEAIKTE